MNAMNRLDIFVSPAKPVRFRILIAQRMTGRKLPGNRHSLRDQQPRARRRYQMLLQGNQANEPTTRTVFQAATGVKRYARADRDQYGKNNRRW